MLAHERVGIFIQTTAVELVKPVLVFGKMRGNPVEYNAQTLFMTAVDKIHKIVRSTEPRSNREIPRNLIAPTAVERIFGYGHKLDVSVARFRGIGGKFFGKLAIRIKIAARFSFPAGKIKFVNVYGRRINVAVRALFHILAVLPLIPRKVVYFRSGFRRSFGVKSIGVGFKNRFAVAAFYGVFVTVVNFKTCNKQLVNAAVFHANHRIFIFVPFVEIAHDRNTFRFRRENSKKDTRLSVLNAYMAAHILV